MVETSSEYHKYEIRDHRFLNEPDLGDPKALEELGVLEGADTIKRILLSVQAAIEGAPNEPLSRLDRRRLGLAKMYIEDQIRQMDQIPLTKTTKRKEGSKVTPRNIIPENEFTSEQANRREQLDIALHYIEGMLKRGAEATTPPAKAEAKLAEPAKVEPAITKAPEATGGGEAPFSAWEADLKNISENVEKLNETLNQVSSEVEAIEKDMQRPDFDPTVSPANEYLKKLEDHKKTLDPEGDNKAKFDEVRVLHLAYETFKPSSPTEAMDVIKKREFLMNRFINRAVDLRVRVGAAQETFRQKEIIIKETPELSKKIAQEIPPVYAFVEPAEKNVDGFTIWKVEVDRLTDLIAEAEKVPYAVDDKNLPIYNDEQQKLLLSALEPARKELERRLDRMYEYWIPNILLIHKSLATLQELAKADWTGKAKEGVKALDDAIKQVKADVEPMKYQGKFTAEVNRRLAEATTVFEKLLNGEKDKSDFMGAKEAIILKANRMNSWYWVGPELDRVIGELRTSDLDDLKKKAGDDPEKLRIFEAAKNEVESRVALQKTMKALYPSIGSSDVKVANLPAASADIDLKASDLKLFVKESSELNPEKYCWTRERMGYNKYGELEKRTVKETPMGFLMRRIDRALRGTDPLIVAGERVTVKNYHKKEWGMIGELAKELQEWSLHGREFSNEAEKKAAMMDDALAGDIAGVALFFHKHAFLPQSFISPDDFSGIPDEIQKTIRMIDYMNYYNVIGRAAHCNDVPLIFSRYVDSDMRHLPNPGLEHYQEEIIKRIPKANKSGKGRPYNYHKWAAGPLVASKPTRGSFVREEKDKRTGEIKKIRISWLPETSFPTFHEFIPMGYFYDRDPAGGTDDIPVKRKTAFDHTMETEFGEEIIYEEIFDGNLDTQIYGSYIVEIRNSIWPFVELMMADPASVIDQMTKDSHWGRWQKIFEYALPFYGGFRDEQDNKKFFTDHLPRCRFYFLLAFLNWGIRRQAITFEKADKILKNASEAQISSERYLGPDGQPIIFKFITDDDKIVLRHILENPIEILGEKGFEVMQSILSRGMGGSGGHH